jgi:hypothetical protein
MFAVNSHQKLATLILRLVAAAWTTFIALGWSMYAIEASVGINVQHYPAHTVIGNMAYIVIGMLVLIFSKSLGKLLGRDLGE